MRAGAYDIKHELISIMAAREGQNSKPVEIIV